MEKSCELLSNYCIFDIIDNARQAMQDAHAVVNCFRCMYL